MVMKCPSPPSSSRPIIPLPLRQVAMMFTFAVASLMAVTVVVDGMRTTPVSVPAHHGHGPRSGEQQWITCSHRRAFLGGNPQRVTTMEMTTPPGRGDTHTGYSDNSGTTTIVNTDDGTSSTKTLSLLRSLELTRNLCTVRRNSVVEVYVDGSLRLGVVTGFRLRRSRNKRVNDDKQEVISAGEEPRIELALVPVGDETDAENDGVEVTTVVDVGQITTVWDNYDDEENEGEGDDERIPSSILVSLSSALRRATMSLSREVSVRGTDRAMERLYDSRRGRGRRGNNDAKGKGRGGGGGGERPLTKKRINKLAEGDAKVAEVLRRAGLVAPRIVTSLDAARYIYGEGEDGNDIGTVRRVAGAVCLTGDAELGGRFKRVPCSFVSNAVVADDEDGGVDVDGVILLNGGWQAVDVSVKSGAEGRKFASRASSSTSTYSSGQIGGGDIDDGGASTKASRPSGKDGGGRDMVAAATEEEKSSSSPTPVLLTEADERIAYRLECLAMGEIDVKDAGSDSEGSSLEMDAREALRSMGLPVTPEGARRALVRIGRWSTSTSSSASSGGKRKRGEGDGVGDTIQPWSESILSAAAEYARHSAAVRDRLARDVAAAGNPQKDRDLEGGRVDLTTLPCVCVDHPRTRFRDDAIGVRPRSGTGRKIVDGAGKWEVLIHVADVTDIYSSNCSFPDRSDDGVREDAAAVETAAEVLGTAAASRGLSRYDLPRGPLHLLPPAALDALGLVVDKPGGAGTATATATKSGSRCNRCVTLWAYVDERSGRVIDAGVERTVISNPIALSFAGATELLEGTGGGRHTSEQENLKRARAILAVAERNLLLWSGYHRSRNVAAAKRESRLAAREVVSRETSPGPAATTGDDDRFRRTRGHRLVDAALDLYAYGASSLLRGARAPIPRASGSGADRGGRLGTAPLRRYIDGVAQRQIVAVLCRRRLGDGRDELLPSPMTVEECREANRIAAKASNALVNYRSVKRGSEATFFASGGSGGAGGGGRGERQRDRQRAALRSLAGHLATVGGDGSGDRRRIVPAIGTGRGNEIAIVGVGAVAKCGGVVGSLSPGQRLMVEVVRLDPERGVLGVRVAPNRPAS